MVSYITSQIQILSIYRCSNLRKTGILHYHVGKDSMEKIFLSIFNYEKNNENIKKGTFTSKWFAVCDLVNNVNNDPYSLKPFNDDGSILLEKTGDKDMPYFLRAIYDDYIKRTEYIIKGE
jgi:hypothetical protein